MQVHEKNEIYEVHPAACIFPMMNDDELAKLAADIKENGLMEPIAIYKDKILDGRNRLKACEMSSVEPRFERLNGEISCPFIYVLSKNLHRRHLTSGQRAAIAAETLPHLVAECQHDASTLPIGNIGRSVNMAAKAAQVGSKSVSRAWAVKKADPEVFEQLKSGNVTPWAAERSLTDKALREEIVNSTRHLRKRPRPDKLADFELVHGRGRNQAMANRKRMIDGIASIDGLCVGLSGLDFGMIRAVCTEEELVHSSRTASRLSGVLRLLSKNIMYREAK